MNIVSLTHCIICVGAYYHHHHLRLMKSCQNATCTMGKIQNVKQELTMNE